jgi:hypothetical protein
MYSRHFDPGNWYPHSTTTLQPQASYNSLPAPTSVLVKGFWRPITMIIRSGMYWTNFSNWAKKGETYGPCCHLKIALLLPTICSGKPID